MAGFMGSFAGSLTAFILPTVGAPLVSNGGGICPHGTCFPTQPLDSPQHAVHTCCQPQLSFQQDMLFRYWFMMCVPCRVFRNKMNRAKALKPPHLGDRGSFPLYSRLCCGL